MCALFQCAVCSGCHQVYLAVSHRSDDNNALAQLSFQLIAQITETIHVHAVNLRCQQLHALDLLYLSHNITQRFLCQLGFQGLVLALQCFQLCQQMVNLLGYIGRSALHCLGDLLHLCFHFFIITEYAVTGQRLDTTHASCDTSLRYDLEGGDHTGILYMGTAAQLHGEISHVDHAHLIAIFLTEQCHSAGLLRLVQRHDLGHNRKGCLDLFIDDLLHLGDLFLGH